MSEHFNGSMRRSLLSIFVADLSLLLVLMAFFIDGPWIRVAAATLGLLLPLVVFALTSGSFVMLAVDEWRTNRVRSGAAFLAVLLGTAAVAVSAGTRPESDPSQRVVAISQGGPADIVVESMGSADATVVADAISSVMDHPDLQLLFDAEPLQLRWAPAWIRTTSVHRVRVIALDVDTARRFGGDARWTGLKTAKAGKGVTLSQRTSAYLSVGRSASRFELLAQGRAVPLEVLQVVEDRGLIGIPGADGLPQPTLFVDPATFDRMRTEGWNDPVRDWSVLSLCGETQQPAAREAGTIGSLPAPGSALDTEGAMAERRCSADPWTSLPYSDRIEEELNLAISNVRSRATQDQPSTVTSAADLPADDVLFDQPGDGEGIPVQFDEPIGADPVGAADQTAAAVAGPIRVDPVKSLAVHRDAWSANASMASDRVVGSLLGTGSVVMVIAGCFVDRRRRSARERLVGVSGGSLAGTWAMVIALSALPGAVLGAAVGSILMTVAWRVLFRASAVPWGDAFSASGIFAEALSWSMLACAFIALALSFLTQKIPLVQAVRGAPLMTARRWIPFGVVNVGGGCLLLAKSGVTGWEAQAGFGLLAAGLGVLTWSIVRSRWVVAGLGIAVAVASVIALQRTWSRPLPVQPSIGALIVALVVMTGGLVGAYAATAPGQHAARLGVPPNDASALLALRTRVATRPGPWPLSPLVGAVIAMTMTCVAASVLIASPPGSLDIAGQQDGVVLQEPTAGTAQRELSAVSSLEGASLIEQQVSVMSGIVASTNPEVPAPERRRLISVGSLGSPTNPSDSESTDEWDVVIGSSAAAALRGQSDGAVVVANVFRSVFGTVPPVGSTVRLIRAGGVEVPVVVAAVIERAPGKSSLWVSDQQFEAMTVSESIEHTVFVYSPQSAQSLRRNLERAFVGTGVAVADNFSTSRPPTQIETFLHRLLDLVIALHLLNAAVLVWRWASERRKALLSTRNAALGPAFLARSVNQDATAHVGAAGLLGSVAGLILGWAVLPSGSDWSPGVLHLVVLVVGPALVAGLVARVPYSGRPGRSVH